jgi:hypothetical protein
MRNWAKRHKRIKRGIGADNAGDGKYIAVVAVLGVIAAVAAGYAVMKNT